MFECDEVLALSQLRVVVQVAEVVYFVRRDAGGLQLLRCLRRRMDSRPVRNQLLDLVLARFSRLVRRKACIVEAEQPSEAAAPASPASRQARPRPVRPMAELAEDIPF